MEDVVLLGVNLTCALVALQSYEIPEKDCLLMLFAKALGYAIIVASTILRLPQVSTPWHAPGRHPSPSLSPRTCSALLCLGVRVLQLESLAA